jgi:hypothetical protein
MNAYFVLAVYSAVIGNMVIFLMVLAESLLKQRRLKVYLTSSINMGFIH